MSWLSFLFPQTVARLSSPFNQEIRINEERGKLKLLVNGSRQSGEQIEKLWREALNTFRIPQDYHVENILVLGVAGGSVIHLLREFYPKAKIVGVDIDQTMIDLGKQYFGLDKMEHVSLVCGDAELFVAAGRGQFNLVIVDLFVGTHVPEFVRNQSFLKNLKSRLTKHGALVINYLREFEYFKKSEDLKRTLVKIFPYVGETCLYNNRFFLGRMVK